MDNLPPGVSDWMLEDHHEPECDNQPAGMPCICLDVIEAKADDATNNLE